MARHKNTNWGLPTRVETWQQVNTAVLMDTRDELQALNRKLDCWRIQRMFRTIERMDKRLSKKMKLR